MIMIRIREAEKVGWGTDECRPDHQPEFLTMKGTSTGMMLFKNFGTSASGQLLQIPEESTVRAGR
jgi:hypothetical protein